MKSISFPTPRTALAACLIVGSSSAYAADIFDATTGNTTNWSNSNNGTTAANISLSGATPNLLLNSDGGNFFAGGFGSTDDINTLKGSALTDSDTVTISLKIDSVTHTGTSELRSRGIQFGMAESVALDGGSATPNSSLILGFGGGGNSGPVDLIIGTDAANSTEVAPAFTIAPSSVADGFSITLTANSTGYTFSYTGLTTSSGTLADVTGTFAPGEFVSNFGAGHFYLLAQKRNSGTTTLDISEASIEVSGVLDTDGDDMPDSYEVANGTNPNVNDAALDKDDDGLTNLQEYLGYDSTDTPTAYGQTLSGMADSDGDNLEDGDEVHGTLNPWSGGVLGSTPGEPTNPNEQDSDDDGDNDNVELTNGTDPNNPPPNTGPVFPFVDSDGDSYSDIAETAFGSSPSDPADCPDHSSSPATPNVVIIYADDMGLGDMSAYGDLYGTPSPAVTPHMNALAAEGTLFTEAHSSNAVCTPSRYSLLTGKYNWREFDGISTHYGYSAEISEIPRASDVTIAEFLKTQAYDTAAFGKWHLGGEWFSPSSNNRITNNPSNPSSVDWARAVEGHAVDHGFDTFKGLGASINFGPYVYLEDDIMQWVTAIDADGVPSAFRPATNDDPFVELTASVLNESVVGAKDSRTSLGDPSYEQVDAGPLMISQVEDYLADRNTSSDPDPFFAYVSLYSPHKPWAITPSFEGSSAADFDYADFMREVDDRIGRVIDAIDNNGFENNTIVIITSDNGPENTAMSQSLNFGKDPNGPLRGNKRDVWEGGTRVPFVIRWPGQAATGMKISAPIWQGDIFATVAAYLGVDLPNTTAPDGESFLNLIRGQQKPAPQRDGVVMASIRGDLGLKTTDGWKFIDSTGGGDSNSWDSSNNTIPGAAGTNQGTPKQLFHLALDLGEDDNLISSLTNDTNIRNELTTLTGTDLLDSLDQLRTNSTTELFPRIPDNDADTLPNSYELLHGLDPNSPKDATTDLDGDGNSNGDEYLAGTDPTDPTDYFHIIDLQNSPTEFTVIWPSVLGRTYTVSWSTDLQTWTPDSTHPATGGLQQALLNKTAIDNVDGILGNLTELFVRISVELP